MGNIIVGLMTQQNDYQNLIKELEQSGFEDSDYIIYHNESGENNTFLASIAANNEHQKQKAEDIFIKQKAIKSYYFHNTDIKEEMPYDMLKKEISIRAKSEIHPSLDIKRKTSNHGLDIENNH